MKLKKGEKDPMSGSARKPGHAQRRIIYTATYTATYTAMYTATYTAIRFDASRNLDIELISAAANAHPLKDDLSLAKTGVFLVNFGLSEGA
jgi:hypothetical protein